MSKRVIFRADDAGASIGTNDAMIEVVGGGLVKNIGLMAPGLAIEDSVRLQGLEVSFGLHAVLNAEWESVKWGPVANGVPSLIDENGYFKPTPMHLHQDGFDLDDVRRELVAQRQRLIDLGFTLTYLDEHMGFRWLPGVRELLVELAREWSLAYAPSVAYCNPFDSADLPAGELAVAVFHPSYLDEDSMRWTNGEIAPGVVAQERDAERVLLANPPELPGIVPVSYAGIPR
jgi:YdjC-like protein